MLTDRVNLARGVGVMLLRFEIIFYFIDAPQLKLLHNNSFFEISKRGKL